MPVSFPKGTPPETQTAKRKAILHRWQRFVLRVRGFFHMKEEATFLSGLFMLYRDCGVRLGVPLVGEGTGGVHTSTSRPRTRTSAASSMSGSAPPSPSVRTLMKDIKHKGYEETPAKCVHEEGKETHCKWGTFLECMTCGQRWRLMNECCHQWLEIGARPFPGAEAPSATPYKLEHEKLHQRGGNPRPAGAAAHPRPAGSPVHYGLSPRPSPPASAASAAPARARASTETSTRRRHVIDEDLEMEWDVTSINLSD